MDPLSVMASVAGLLSAALEVSELLGPYVSAFRETPPVATHVRDEAQSTRTVLIGLQSLIRDFDRKAPPGGALVGVDQVVAILMSGVLLFAELEGAVRGLVVTPSSPVSDRYVKQNSPGGVLGIPPAWHQIPLRDRMRWAHREEPLKPLLARLQAFKVSVTVVLTLLQCDSDRRAEQLQTDLVANVSALLDSNRELSRRMMNIEDVLDTRTIRSQTRQSIIAPMAPTKAEAGHDVPTTLTRGGTLKASTTMTEEGESPSTPSACPPKCPLDQATSSMSKSNAFQSVFEFETDLETSRVYRRVQRDSMDFSFRSSIARTHAWSALSGPSLADVSTLSVIALPLDLEEVTNSQHYIDTSAPSQVSETLQWSPVTRSLYFPEGDRPLYYACGRIFLQLVQIPGFQDLFDEEWKKQLEEQKLDELRGSNQEWFWLQLDVFKALQGVFQQAQIYRLTTDKVERDLDTKVMTENSPDTRDTAFSSLCFLGSTLGIKPDEMLNQIDASGKSNARFLRVLDYVTSILNRLADVGVIHIMDEQTLASNITSATLLPDSEYKKVLNRLVNTQRSFVQHMLRLLNILEKLEKQGHHLAKLPRTKEPLLPVSTVPLTSEFFAEYASCEIEFLLQIERMLLAPPLQIPWSTAVSQWATTAETRCASMIIEEKDTKEFLLRGAATKSSILSVQTLLTSLPQLLSRPPQVFLQTAQLLREIFRMPLGEVAGTKTVTTAQKDDFTEGQRLVNRALGVVSEKIRQSELNNAFQELVPRVEDWKNHKISSFGNLKQFGIFNISDGGLSREHHIYLFDTVLLLFREDKRIIKRTQVLLRLARLGNEAVMNDKPPKLSLKGRIYVSSIKAIATVLTRNSKKMQIWWQSDSDIESSSIHFTSHQESDEWYEVLMRLSPSISPGSIGSPNFNWMQGLSLQNPYIHESGDEDHTLDDQHIAETSSRGGDQQSEVTTLIPRPKFPAKMAPSAFPWPMGLIQGSGLESIRESDELSMETLDSPRASSEIGRTESIHSDISPPERMVS
ncbi:Pleckstrin homology domain-containing protein [Xylariaceae sp. FL0255]|nr:Pleckstrin homology domain-containing protein [Xylariaceae sp. FL0255]